MFWQSLTEFIGRWWSFWRRWTARSIGWCRPEVRGSRWTCSKSNLKNHQSDRFISGSGLPGCTAAEWTTRSYRGIPAWTRGWAPSKRPVDGTADTPPKSRPTSRQIIMNCNWLNRPEAFFFFSDVPDQHWQRTGRPEEPNTSKSKYKRQYWSSIGPIKFNQTKSN